MYTILRGRLYALETRRAIPADGSHEVLNQGFRREIQPGDQMCAKFAESPGFKEGRRAESASDWCRASKMGCRSSRCSPRKPCPAHTPSSSRKSVSQGGFKYTLQKPGCSDCPRESALATCGGAHFGMNQPENRPPTSRLSVSMNCSTPWTLKEAGVAKPLTSRNFRACCGLLIATRLNRGKEALGANGPIIRNRGGDDEKLQMH